MSDDFRTDALTLIGDLSVGRGVERRMVRRAVDFLNKYAPKEKTDAQPDLPAVPCPEGFHWIGQTFTSCDKCGLPAWEHAGTAELPAGAKLFGQPVSFVLKPFLDGEAKRIKAKWDR